MNTGIISTRYATALFKYTEETGGGERVCAQVRQLLASHQDMMSVKLEPELERFVALLIKNGRIDLVRFIFRSFIAMYYNSIGVKLAHITTALPSPELVDSLHNLLEKQFGCKVLLESDVNPDIVGGFVIEIGDYLLDASVKDQIDMMHRQFVIKSNRIV